MAKERRGSVDAKQNGVENAVNANGDVSVEVSATT